ncbi:hypothetical protein FNV43_RR00543 [Rhamnella rubrinervis]|uniref:Helicase MOV-10-like beta-barrel domain-containing protein n=1 Tax=Rhamnella rubrinervis TaxID=2594499 RepID=A0A8K0MR98_9ROSA|nr:hypothetical protein FNV43_RR00543 [Rhamnella rubrinervis]
MSIFLDFLRCLLCCEYEDDQEPTRDHFQEPTSYRCTPRFSNQSSSSSFFVVPEESKLPLLSTSSYNYTFSPTPKPPTISTSKPPQSSSIYQASKPATSSSEPPQSSSKPAPKPQTISSSKPSPTQPSPASPFSSTTSLPSFNGGPSPSIYQPSKPLKPATSSSEPPQSSSKPTPKPQTISFSKPSSTQSSPASPFSPGTSLPSSNGGPSLSIYQPSKPLKPATSSSEPPQSSSKPAPKPQTISSSKPSSTQSSPASPFSSRTSLPSFNGDPSPSIYQPSKSLKPAASSSEPPQSSSKPTPKLQIVSSSIPSSTQSFSGSPSPSRTSLPSFNGGPSPSSPKPSSQKLPPIFKPFIRETSPNGTNRKGKANYEWVEKDSLPLYMTPEDMKDLIKKDIVPDVLKKPLSPLTYKDYFAALLYAEDYYHEKWSDFEMENVTLELQKAVISKRHNKNKHVNQSKKEDNKIFVQFEIDSVPENRPFLLSRDVVYARPSGSNVDPFQGVIFRLLRSTLVLVEFEDDFYLQHYSTRKYDISFSFNRVCLKRAHQALNAVSDNLLENFLFPNSKSVLTDTALSSHFVKYHSDTASTVSQILSTQSSPPYLVAGPLCVTERKADSHLREPSKTGKVVWEAVVKIYNSSPRSRILISAPSNSACDVLMRCLTKRIPESQMFRANAAFREKEDVPDDILPSCLYKRECFACPSLHELQKFRVIFSTFMSCFRLHNEGIAAGHFSHIFLVDASSAIEPEALVTLANFAHKNTAVIVTGQPGNSSRWIRSEIGRKKGLKISYFERLCECRTYRTLNPKLFANLDQP